MPYTIKSQQIAVKDPDTGEYVGVDLLTEQTTEGLLNEIAQEGAATIARVNDAVAQSQTAVNNLQQQKDDLVTSVTDMLSTGTDNTLTTPSVPADAKAVGDLYETIVVDSETQPNNRWNRVWVKPSTEDVEIPTMDEVDLINNTIGLNSFLTGVATDTYRGITIEKQYNELIINGTATGNARFKVSNTMAHAVSIQDSWLTETIDIPNGPKKVIIEIVSGEVTSGSMYCALYKSNGETTFTNVTDTTTTEPKNIITFEKSNNDAVCVVVYCPANTSVDNLHLRFIMVDQNINKVFAKELSTPSTLFDDGYYSLVYSEGTYISTTDHAPSTWYSVTVPLLDENSSIIPIQADYSETYDSPNMYASNMHTTLTVNAGMGLSNGQLQGAVIKDGIIIRESDYVNPPSYLVYVGFDANRNVHEYPVNTTAENMLNDGIKNACIAYYRLIRDGTKCDYESYNLAATNYERNPRMCIFVRSNGVVGFIAVDGRSDVSYGVTPDEMADLALSRNAYNAWMLDGGGSTSLNYKGAKINANIDGNGTTDRKIKVTWNIPCKFENLASQKAYSYIGNQRNKITKFFQDQLNKKIPSPPSNDGKYCLKLRIENGIYTYFWEVESA